MASLYVGREGRVSWQLDGKARSLSLQGKGALPDFEPFSGGLPGWAPLRDLVREVRIEKGVERIGDYAFFPYDYGMYSGMRSRIERVSFPSSLESIGRCAFRSNGRLKSINLIGCARLRTIGEGAFASCHRAQGADLSGCSSLRTIEPHAFLACDSLSYIDLSGCHSLERESLRALRDEVPGNVPIVMPDGRISCAADRIPFSLSRLR